MMGATTPAYPCWVGGTAIGVLAGDLIGDPAPWGLTRSSPLLPLPAGRGRAAAGPAGPRRRLGSLVALVLIPFTPAGVPVIAASATA